jgi:PTS system nitrogen regulatory IIA component
MSIASILTPSRTHSAVTGSSKKRVLEKVAQLVSDDIPSLESGTLFKNLVSREKLGSTSIGHGIAIPHCRMSMCEQITGALIRLQKAVDFEAIDDEPVDLLFVLLVPEEACDEHLQTLGQLAQLFSREEFREALRAAGDSQDLYQTAIDFEQAGSADGAITRLSGSAR